MKQRHTLLSATLLSLALVGNAMADRDHRNRHDGWNTSHRQFSGHHHHEHRPRGHKHWIGPAAVLALGGLTLGAIAYSSPPSPVVYTAPPPPVTGNWYFCRSSGQYYPYTQACPEGWQAVAPR